MWVELLWEPQLHLSVARELFERIESEELGSFACSAAGHENHKAAHRLPERDGL
jgi:hypothetical protein